MFLKNLAAFALGGLATIFGGWLWRLRQKSRQLPVLSGWPRVVVVGAGFGGLRVARGLAGVEADVLVLDRHNYHCFQPLLYQVATAGLEPEEIAHSVRQILRSIPNVRFRMATVQQIDLAARQLQTDVGPVPYDYLVLAPGSVTNFFGIPGLAETALGIKGLSEAVAVRNHLLECFERAIGEPDPGRRAALLTFVVAGGGPTGVELAGALVELIRHVLAHDYRGLDLTNARVVLVEAGPALLPALPADLQKAAGRDLRQKGVDVRLGTGVRSFQDDVVALATGENLPAATLLWAAGVRATDLGSQLGAPLERQGRVKVEPTLQLTDHPEVFVIGDLAHFAVDGAKPLPMVAPVAIQQGDHVALNLRRQLAGRPLAPFTYHDKGTMATIGRNSAVCQIGPFHLTGFLAWVAWLAVHLLQIVSFRNRLLVLVNWIWDYFFYDSAVRLITRD